MKKVRLLDAFAGIGGFHLGVKQACKELNIEFECIGVIEFDKKCRKTYELNFPNTEFFENDKYYKKEFQDNKKKKVGDITQLDLSKLPKHDILCGGFPCQPFSASGLAHIKNKSKIRDEDKRSKLYLYLLDILQEKQPQYFIFENVKGLLTIKENDEKLLNNILIPEIEKMKYYTDYFIMTPYDVGLPQKRERLFIVGNKTNIINKPIKNQYNTSIKDILDKCVNSSYYLENKWKNRYLTLSPDGIPYNDDVKILRLNKLYENLKERNQKYAKKTKKSNTTILAAEVTNDTPSGRSRQHDRAYHIHGQCPTLTTIDAQIIYEPKTEKFRTLTPNEYGRLQEFIDDNYNFIINSDETVAYSQLGNAVCVKLVKLIFKTLLKGH